MHLHECLIVGLSRGRVAVYRDNIAGLAGAYAGVIGQPDDRLCQGTIGQWQQRCAEQGTGQQSGAQAECGVAARRAGQLQCAAQQAHHRHDEQHQYRHRHQCQPGSPKVAADPKREGRENRHAITPGKWRVGQLPVSFSGIAGRHWLRHAGQQT